MLSDVIWCNMGQASLPPSWGVTTAECNTKLLRGQDHKSNTVHQPGGI